MLTELTSQWRPQSAAVSSYSGHMLPFSMNLMDVMFLFLHIIPVNSYPFKMYASIRIDLYFQWIRHWYIDVKDFLRQIQTSKPLFFFPPLFPLRSMKSLHVCFYFLCQELKSLCRNFILPLGSSHCFQKPIYRDTHWQTLCITLRYIFRYSYYATITALSAVLPLSGTWVQNKKKKKITIASSPPTGNT